MLLIIAVVHAVPFLTGNTATLVAHCTTYHAHENKGGGNKWGGERTEREGFEPSVRFDPYTHLAGERLQPDSAISPIKTILTFIATFVNNFLRNIPNFKSKNIHKTANKNSRNRLPHATV